MIDWSLSRRAALQMGGLAALVGVTGCSAFTGRQTGAISLYVYNETDSELTATLHYLTCDQVGEEQQSIGVEANMYSYSANTVVEDSGTCSLEVTVPDGRSETYEWNVDRKTLVITITPDSIEFERRSPTYAPGD